MSILMYVRSSSMSRSFHPSIHHKDTLNLTTTSCSGMIWVWIRVCACVVVRTCIQDLDDLHTFISSSIFVGTMGYPHIIDFPVLSHAIIRAELQISSVAYFWELCTMVRLSETARRYKQEGSTKESSICDARPWEFTSFYKDLCFEDFRDRTEDFYRNKNGPCGPQSGQAHLQGPCGPQSGAADGWPE